jgi:hypothetical protein
MVLDHVADVDRRFAAGRQNDRSMVLRVSPRVDHRDLRRDGVLAVDQLQHARSLQRQEVLGQVRRARTLGGVGGRLPLAAPDQVSRARKRRDNLTGFVRARVPAAVVRV